MPAPDAPELLHVAGYVTGVTLYAMLLAMVVRGRGGTDRLTIATAVLGLAWNLGELAAHALAGLAFPMGSAWVAAASYAALGFLSSVAVHSAGRGQTSTGAGSARMWGRATAVGAYACATAAGLIQLLAAARGEPLPSSFGLMFLTAGLLALAPALFLATRRQPHRRRALWISSLALFAVSALHLSSYHGVSETWPTEILGHHASIPLAFAILYQEYRFALADLFLKRALTLLALVTVVFSAWAALAPRITVDADGTSGAVGLLLLAWIGTALIFPWLRKAVQAFVDHVVLMRADYASFIERIAAAVQQCESPDAVLAETCAALRPALSAQAVTWRSARATDAAAANEMLVPTAEDPAFLLSVGELTGGRRLLSDDVTMLHRVAFLAARRIDALRLGEERYDRVLRERQISTLATEAELRALRAQLNPHFLFNALTTLGYLIQSAPPRALDTLMRLTTLLRAVLRPEGEFTTLGQERELIECYLNIEAERFEERLQVRIDIPDDLAHVPIPALIVQPLVENAIKHGIAPAREGGSVTVTAGREGDRRQAPLKIVVRNTGAPWNSQSPSSGFGIGLRNVQQRLRGYYGDDATLTLRSDSGGATLAELWLPASRVYDDTAPALVEQARR